MSATTTPPRGDVPNVIVGAGRGLAVAAFVATCSCILYVGGVTIYTNDEAKTSAFGDECAKSGRTFAYLGRSGQACKAADGGLYPIDWTPEIQARAEARRWPMIKGHLRASWSWVTEKVGSRLGVTGTTPTTEDPR